MTSLVSKCQEQKSFVTTDNSGLLCRISPLVVVTCLDSFARRPAKAGRAIGTLLGYVSEGNILDIVDCFAVLHEDSDVRGVLMDQHYHRRMVGLRTSVHEKEQVVGWFSVGNKGIDENARETVNIHNFYRTKDSLFVGAGGSGATSLPNPVYLEIDTELRHGTPVPLGIKVYTNAVVPYVEDMLQFHQLPIMKTDQLFAHYEQEKNIMDMLLDASKKDAGDGDETSNSTSINVDTLDNFSRNLDDLMDLFERAKQYVEAVLQGHAKPEIEVGRALHRALTTEAMFDREKFDEICQGAMKDTLMVKYLSSLSKTQILLSEKIGQILSASAGDAH